jgi:hypothetical protein
VRYGTFSPKNTLVTFDIGSVIVSASLASFAEIITTESCLLTLNLSFNPAAAITLTKALYILLV